MKIWENENVNERENNMANEKNYVELVEDFGDALSEDFDMCWDVIEVLGMSDAYRIDTNGTPLFTESQRKLISTALGLVEMFEAENAEQDAEQDA